MNFSEAVALKELSSSLGALLNNPQFSDVTFILESGTQIFAHRVILSTRSEIFKLQFLNTHFQESKQNEVKICDLHDENSFMEMLRFIYTGKYPKIDTISDALSLLTLSDRYMIPDLKAYCLNDVYSLNSMDSETDETSLSSALSSIHEMRKFRGSTLYDECLHSIIVTRYLTYLEQLLFLLINDSWQLSSITKITSNELTNVYWTTFLHLDEEMIKIIFDSDYLQLPEWKTFMILYLWIHHRHREHETMKDDDSKLLSLIRFSSLSPSSIIELDNLKLLELSGSKLLDALLYWNVCDEALARRIPSPRFHECKDYCWFSSKGLFNVPKYTANIQLHYGNVYYIEFKIGELLVSQSQHVLIGVAKLDVSLAASRLESRSADAWCFSSLGYLTNKLNRTAYGSKLSSYDTVGVLVNLSSNPTIDDEGTPHYNTISFFRKGKYLGIAFEDIPKDITLIPVSEGSSRIVSYPENFPKLYYKLKYGIK